MTLFAEFMTLMAMQAAGPDSELDCPGLLGQQGTQGRPRASIWWAR